LIGFFPQLGLQALRSLVALPLRSFVPTLRSPFPLSALDGMNIWYESRLLEEGIEDIQNLATANVVDVMLRTRIPVDRLVDWIDQAHLYLHLWPTKPPEPAPAAEDRPRWNRRGKPKASDISESESRATLRRYGIRTATDIENIFDSGEPALIEEHRWLLNAKGSGPSVTETIYRVLADEPNLRHVRSWKAPPARGAFPSSAETSTPKESPRRPAARPKKSNGPAAPRA
jgi:hypothetical protein